MLSSDVSVLCCCRCNIHTVSKHKPATHQVSSSLCVSLWSWFVFVIRHQSAQHTKYDLMRRTFLRAVTIGSLAFVQTNEHHNLEEANTFHHDTHKIDMCVSERQRARGRILSLSHIYECGARTAYEHKCVMLRANEAERKNTHNISYYIILCTFSALML